MSAGDMSEFSEWMRLCLESVQEITQKKQKKFLAASQQSYLETTVKRRKNRSVIMTKDREKEEKKKSKAGGILALLSVNDHRSLLSGIQYGEIEQFLHEKFFSTGEYFVEKGSSPV